VGKRTGGSRGVGDDEPAVFRHLVEAVPDAVMAVDDGGIIRFANASAGDLLGWSRTGLVGRALRTVVPTGAPEPLQGSSRAPGSPSWPPGGPGTADRPAGGSRPSSWPAPFHAARPGTARRSDGSELPVAISVRRIEAAQGRFTAVVVRPLPAPPGGHGDADEAFQRLQETVAEMDRQRRQTELVTEMADMLQSALDQHEAYAVVAAFVAELFPGTSGAVFRSTPSRAFLDVGASWGRQREEIGVLHANACWALRRGRPHRSMGPHGVLWCQHLADVADQAGWGLCVPLAAHGEMLGLLHLRADPGHDAPSAAPESAVAVAEHLGMALANLALRESLQAASSRDALTGLFNRRHFEATVAEVLASGAATGVATSLLLLDVDGFKAVNDHQGHEAGDSALRATAHLLVGEVRSTDVVCRIGGDELAVVLPATDIDAATARAEQLRRAVAKNLPITISVGVAASSPDHQLSAEELLREADLCLYRAKSLGKDRVVASVRPSAAAYERPAP
jgi:diguanylate cyclase (GGDEF)-like protein